MNDIWNRHIIKFLKWSNELRNESKKIIMNMMIIVMTKDMVKQVVRVYSFSLLFTISDLRTNETLLSLMIYIFSKQWILSLHWLKNDDNNNDTDSNNSNNNNDSNNNNGKIMVIMIVMIVIIKNKGNSNIKNVFKNEGQSISSKCQWGKKFAAVSCVQKEKSEV